MRALQRHTVRMVQAYLAQELQLGRTKKWVSETLYSSAGNAYKINFKELPENTQGWLPLYMHNLQRLIELNIEALLQRTRRDDQCHKFAEQLRRLVPADNVLDVLEAYDDQDLAIIPAIKPMGPDPGVYEIEARRRVYGRAGIFYYAIYGRKTKTLIKVPENQTKEFSKLQRSLPSYMNGECILERLEKDP